MANGEKELKLPMAKAQAKAKERDIFI